MIKKVVLTGGPGSGKTTVLNKIKDSFNSRNVKVVVVGETATEVINSGIKSFGEDKIDIVDFQELILSLQLSKERIFDRAIEFYSDRYPSKDILVIYDRGVIDNKAFINDQEFVEVMNRVDKSNNYSLLLNNYDLIIDLVSAKEFYTTQNNEARSEDVDNALKLGNDTLKSWLGHPKLKIILPKEKIEDKVLEVSKYLNELMSKKQIKNQKKYLVDLSKTDINHILSIGNSALINQTYLISNDNYEKRLRKTFMNDSLSYNLTVYKILDDCSKVLESSKNIDEKIYNELLEFKMKDKKTIVKNRIYFDYLGAYMYLDIFYDDGKREDIGYLEIDDDKEVSMPLFISILEDVTLDQNYNNFNKATRDSLSNNKKLIYT